jgi:glycosyltransferase involved in cell wall biosynthesis
MISSSRNSPLVSIIIPAYNSEKYLVRALKSAGNQTYRKIEICLVDDGSTDQTERVFREYIRDNPDIPAIYRYQDNQGVAAARNLAIASSRGEFLCFLDADDILKPECVETLLDYSIMYPDAEIISGGCEALEFDQCGHLSSRGVLSIEKIEFLSPRAAFEKLFCQNLLGMISVLVSRKAFDQAGGFNQDFKSCEDLDFWLKVAQSAPILLIPEVLGIVYKYPEGLSRNPRRLYRDMRDSFRRHKDYLFRNYPGTARGTYRKARAIAHLIAFDLHRRASTPPSLRCLYHLLGILICMPSLVFSRMARKRLHAERTGFFRNSVASRRGKGSKG